MSPTPTALDVARALIAFPSVTPADGGALPYLRDLLVRGGFKAELVTFAAPGTPDVLNLYARIGSGPPNLVFAGHTDVVPPGDVTRWRFDPFSAAVADGFLWGRGACDMKGGVAAAVAAALRFVARSTVRRQTGVLPALWTPEGAVGDRLYRARSASSSPGTRKARRSTARSS